MDEKIAHPMVVNVAISNDKKELLVLGGHSDKLRDKILKLTCKDEMIDKNTCHWVELQQKLKIPRSWGVTMNIP